MFKIGDVLTAKPGIRYYYMWNYTTLLVVGVEFDKYRVVVLQSLRQAYPAGYETSLWKKFADENYATVENHV